MNVIAPLVLFELALVSLCFSDGFGWNGFAAALLGIRADVYRVPAMVQHRVNVHVGPPVWTNCACDGRRYSRIQARGDVDVIPAGVSGMWVDDADCRILRVAISDRFVRSIAEQIGVQADITSRLQWRDARVRHLAAVLGTELQAEDTSDVLYAEGLRMALVARLFSSNRGGAAGVADRAGTLVLRVATRVIDYIEVHLHAHLTLAELAVQAGLSVPHLNVLFRVTLGMPAHRYIVQRRVVRAKALLLEGRYSVLQIALDASFAYQSHMTQWTQRLFGVIPRDVIRVGKALAATADTPTGQPIHRICQIPLFL